MVRRVRPATREEEVMSETGLFIAWLEAGLPPAKLMVLEHDAHTRAYGFDRWGWRGNQYGKHKEMSDSLAEEQASQGR